MGHFSPTLRRTARRQHGIVSGAQLRDDGIPAESIDRWRLRRLVVVTHPDIYRVASAPDTLESRCVTTSLAVPDAVIGGAAAAALWDLDHVFRPTRPECVHDQTVTVEQPVHGVAYRGVRTLDDRDRVERGDAILVLSRAATWLDCVGHMNREHARRFTAHVLDSQCDLDELWEVVTRRESARRGKPGRAHNLLAALRGKHKRDATAA